MADKPEDIGVLLAVDVEPGPFLPGPGIYPVGMEVFPVIRQVDIGELDAGRVVLPVQGCCDGEVAVIGFLLFRAAERHAAVSFQESEHEFQHGLPGLVQPSVDKRVLDGEQVQFVGVHFVRDFARFHSCCLVHICIFLVSCFQRGEGDGQYHLLVTQVEYFQAIVPDGPFQDVAPIPGVAYLEGKIIDERVENIKSLDPLLYS